MTGHIATTKQPDFYSHSVAEPPFSALTLLVGQQEGHPALEKGPLNGCVCVAEPRSAGSLYPCPCFGKDEDMWHWFL